MGSEIIAFPLHRRRKLVSDLASVLASKHGDDATAFWRETAKDLLCHLASAGVENDNAQDQVRSLLYAVVAEMEGDAVKARG